MKIDIGQTVTVLANVGVIAGIAFLAFELRQNTQAIQVAASQDMASELAAFNEYWADTELAGLRVRALNEGFSSLTDAEQVQLAAVYTSFIVIHQNLFHQFLEGTLEEDLWEGRHNVLVALSRGEMFVATWAQIQIGFSQQFRDYINNVVIPEGMGLDP